MTESGLTLAVTADSAYWTINEVPYLLKLNKKVIKIFKNAIDTSDLTETEKIKSYKFINDEATIDAETIEKDYGRKVTYYTNCTKKSVIFG